MFDEEKIIRTIGCICRKKDISYDDLIELLKDRDYRYMTILLLKKRGCENRLSDMFAFKSRRSMMYNMKKAEERFFINSEFRKKYFDLEKEIEKIE